MISKIYYSIFFFNNRSLFFHFKALTSERKLLKANL